MFYRKWSSIRIRKPVDTEMRQDPKNLDTIQIIERPQDSLILDNCTRKAFCNYEKREIPQKVGHRTSTAINNQRIMCAL
ncbi:hypothetical protein FSP39_005412 [Pinctada imbricata]|uniref:Uncharacterized protein n=1 Tax=Pinctada imbricata TaxID=66713 RepID=A0AA88YGB9_PINIB|nr:hypothetical protein FSP39_005412 [Pinctada imbricata]